MKFRRLTKAVLASVAALSLMVACSSTPATPEPAATDASGTVRVWFMRDSVTESGQQWLKDEFKKAYPKAELQIEVQEWDGIVAKLQTSMASADQTPDVVEFGNTKVGTFANVGALADISDLYEPLGGENLIKSFIDAGTVDGKKYAYPMYAGVRVFYYRKDLFTKAGVEVPQSLPELTEAAAKVQAANPDGAKNFKGIYLPAADTHSAEGWLFSYGVNYAKKDGDKWVGTLSTPEAQAALGQLQTLWTKSALGVFDSADARKSPWVPFNNGEVAMFTGLPNVEANIAPELRDKVGVFALPPAEKGGTAHSFSGGSSLGISAKSKQQPLAKEVMKLIYGKEFQTKLASESGWMPGNTSYSGSLPDGLSDPSMQADVAKNSVLTPAAENWAVVEGDVIPADTYAAIAQGKDIATVTKEADAKIEGVLNK